MRLALAFLAAALLPTAASASAPWVDDLGRQMTMQFAGGGTATTPRSPHGHDAAAFVSAFSRVCIDTGMVREVAGLAAEGLDWGFAYQPEMVPFKPPVDIGGWYAGDAVVNVGSGLFFNKHAQCNLVGTPAGGDFAALTAALGTRFGTPVNAAKATKKDGKPNPSYAPEWEVALPQGGTTRVKAMQVYGNPSEIMISALKKVEK
jgi:hypothetical protein